METPVLMLCWVLLWLVPAILDTVVQITNSVVVNKMAQGEDVKFVLTDSNLCLCVTEGHLNYPPALCCIPEQAVETTEKPTGPQAAEGDMLPENCINVFIPNLPTIL